MIFPSFGEFFEYIVLILLIFKDFKTKFDLINQEAEKRDFLKIKINKFIFELGSEFKKKFTYFERLSKNFLCFQKF